MRSINEYDVIIVGGGPGGIGAAVAAGKSGAKTLLLEREGCLGGGATTMYVHPFMSELTKTDAQGQPPRKIVNAGVFSEVKRRLVSKGASKRANVNCQDFDDEVLKVVYDELVSEAGVKVLFHVALFDVRAENGTVKSVRLAHNREPIEVTGKVFIDATGDALLSAGAGAEIQIGDDAGKVMPMTLNFAVANVDVEKVPFKDLKKIVATGAQDTPPLINTHLSCTSIIPTLGWVHFNAVRIPGDTLDVFDVSRAEMEGRRRAMNYVEWLRAKVPGFENAVLAKTGSHIGIRESRRVIGDYILTGDDFKASRKFDDGIACSSYMVDIHGQVPGQTTYAHQPPGEYYQIPYRCLTPRGLRNVLIGSRAASSDVMAHSSLRIMPVVMNLGEAAGFAAAMTLPHGDVRKIDVQALRQKIRSAGGAIDPLPME